MDANVGPDIVRPSATPPASASLVLRLLVHRVRRQIDLTGPRHRALVDVHALEKRSVAQRSEHAGEFSGRELHLAAGPIREPHEQTVVWLRLDFHYVPIHRRSPFPRWVLRVF